MAPLQRYLSSILITGGFLASPSFAVSPVVVELFESQGCSSCPPAERVMEKLHQEFGDQVILMTYHVDYWDYLGWKDPFSDPRWTERQKGYGRLFNQDNIYTPEMVIQGEVGFVGSDLRRARAEVSERLKRADSTAQPAQRVWIRVEDFAPVPVTRGENAGITMSGQYAVRDLQSKPFTAKTARIFRLETDSSGRILKASQIPL